MSDNIKEVDKEVGRKLLIAVVDAIYKQIKEDPLNVSASTLAVAERMLARWNLGMIETTPDDGLLSPEEKEMIAKFEELTMDIDNDLFTKED